MAKEERHRMMNLNANDLSDFYLAALVADAMVGLSLLPGIYASQDGIFKVQAGRNSGRTYAKRLVGNKFEYAPGAIYRLAHEDKLSLGAARKIGHAIGVCVKCGAELTDQVSVERGIGPVCEKRWGGTRKGAKAKAKRAA